MAPASASEDSARNIWTIASLVPPQRPCGVRLVSFRFHAIGVRVFAFIKFHFPIVRVQRPHYSEEFFHILPRKGHFQLVGVVASFSFTPPRLAVSDHHVDASRASGIEYFHCFDSVRGIPKATTSKSRVVFVVRKPRRGLSRVEGKVG